MKVSINHNEPALFQPRSVTIVFESQKELDAFGKLFNTAAVASVMREEAGLDEFDTPLYRIIEDLGGVVSPSLHDKLKKEFI